MTPLQEHIALLPAAELDRLQTAARRFEATASEGVVDALPADLWLFETRGPPLVFVWPLNEADSSEILQDVLVGARPSTGLLRLPDRWLRLATGEATLRRRELEWAEALAEGFRDALLRSEGGNR